MNSDEDVFYAILITKGRRSGKEHAVELKAVRYENKFYFSRTNPYSDWLRNAKSNPRVKVKVGKRQFSGTAALVNDKQLVKKISSLKYSDNRSLYPRIVLEVIPDE